MCNIVGTKIIYITIKQIYRLKNHSDMEKGQ
jgi:hypothetical protein